MGTTDDCDSTAQPDSSTFTLTLDVPVYEVCSQDTDITSPTRPSADSARDCQAWTDKMYQWTGHASVTSCQSTCTTTTTTLVRPSTTTTTTTTMKKECSDADVILLAGAKWEVYMKWDCGGQDLWWSSTHTIEEVAQECLDRSACLSFNRNPTWSHIKKTFQKSNVLGKDCGASSTSYSYFTKVPTDTPVTCSDGKWR